MAYCYGDYRYLVMRVSLGDFNLQQCPNAEAVHSDVNATCPSSVSCTLLYSLLVTNYAAIPARSRARFPTNMFLISRKFLVSMFGAKSTDLS